MNPYARLSSGSDVPGAADLCERLSAWHDAMVEHERRLRARRDADACDEDCPHAEATALWSDAVAILGDRAATLTFLRGHGDVEFRSAAR